MSSTNAIRKKIVILTPLVIALIFIIFLFGIDEPIVGAINKPNYSCKADSDCIVKVSGSSENRCDIAKCVNRNWNYYTSKISDILKSRGCPMPAVIDLMPGEVRYLNCSCVQNKCNTTLVIEYRPISTGEIRIDNADCGVNNTILTIRNIGLKIVEESTLTIYVNNIPKNCSWSGMPLGVGRVATCTINEGDFSGQRIKIVSPSEADEITCN